MSKKAYVGVSDKARNSPKEYIGVNNVARKVIKGYVGVNNIARQFWPPGNAWNDYAGVRLVFDYDYKPGITYTRHKAGILDTIRYGIQKTIFMNRGTNDYDSFLNLLESKIDDILDYVSDQLISSDDTVMFHAELSSAFHNISFWAYIGNSNASTVKIERVYDDIYKNFIRNVIDDPEAEGKNRIYVRYKLYSNGNVEKEVYPNTGTNIRRAYIGNTATDSVVNQWGIYYLSYLTNVGVHFENFNSGNVVANFDFTNSIYDTIDDLVACSTLLNGDSHLDGSGLHLNDSSAPNSYPDAIQVPGWCLKYSNTIEIVIGAYTVHQSYTSILFWSGRQNTVILEYIASEGYWKFEFGSTAPGSRPIIEPIGVSDAGFFQNSTVKIHYDERGIIKLYKNNVLVYTSIAFGMVPSAKNGVATIFSNMEGTVTRLKFFNE